MKVFGYIGVFVAIVAVCSIIGAFILQWFWGWVIPDVFSGAVHNGNKTI